MKTTNLNTPTSHLPSTHTGEPTDVQVDQSDDNYDQAP